MALVTGVRIIQNPARPAPGGTHTYSAPTVSRLVVAVMVVPRAACFVRHNPFEITVLRHCAHS